MSALDIVSNALGGGVLGAAGAAFNRWHQASTELKRMALTHEHELALAKLELEQSKIQATVAVERSGDETLEASYMHDTSLYTANGGFVEAVRALVRPLLTALLVGSTIYMGLAISEHTLLEQVVAAKLLTQIVDGLVGCTGMALAWWFGARSTGNK